MHQMHQFNFDFQILKKKYRVNQFSQLVGQNEEKNTIIYLRKSIKFDRLKHFPKPKTKPYTPLSPILFYFIKYQRINKELINQLEGRKERKKVRNKQIKKKNMKQQEMNQLIVKKQKQICKKQVKLTKKQKKNQIKQNTNKQTKRFKEIYFYKQQKNKQIKSFYPTKSVKFQRLVHFPKLKPRLDELFAPIKLLEKLIFTKQFSLMKKMKKKYELINCQQNKN
ncbi:hypothetical protein TTHERM_001379980 (macronuclear) [Tetrahymena thermophila SB210]|uniref:Uncharacterized protein n=1 Tax=Tetrahymena thermophila (strain SB210) TaxID=312017 RepID=W7XI22_TETTS|nr:hypothetical protein TTHERM_001379980 [Tetrahymena thermophila SB210]EWS74276.1 hypothetical protein TTHERM_001379980 [Tetrahymena thermophila SB210]|eukprot:XP_012653191.1 hypothetical protein TTHERM_001379980 [Tetrahymena thermophila SB210]